MYLSTRNKAQTGELGVAVGNQGHCLLETVRGAGSLLSASQDVFIFIVNHNFY